MRNKDGIFVDCYIVCDKIIIDFMSEKLSQSNQRELIQNNRQFDSRTILRKEKDNE